MIKLCVIALTFHSDRRQLFIFAEFVCDDKGVGPSVLWLGVQDHQLCKSRFRLKSNSIV